MEAGEEVPVEMSPSPRWVFGTHTHRVAGKVTLTPGQSLGTSRARAAERGAVRGLGLWPHPALPMARVALTTELAARPPLPTAVSKCN